MQHFRLKTDPDPSGSRGFDEQILKKKFTAEKKVIIFWDQNYNLPIPRPP
jgi:hypothetical protein